MSDKPKLLVAEMVRAVLDGRKTETRTPVKRLKMHADFGQPDWKQAWLDGTAEQPYLKIAYVGGPGGTTVHRHYPQYEVGDRMYVRETWRINSVGYYCSDHTAPHIIDIEYGCLPGDARGASENVCGNDESLSVARHYYHKHAEGQFSPSIHMPKWAARIFRPVTAVRFERMQEITEAGAMAEGVCFDDCYYSLGRDYGAQTYRELYKRLWDSLYGKKYPWASNPWVEVVTFERSKL